MSASAPMKTRGLILIICAMVAASPLPTAAWGLDVHRRIMARAVDALPTSLKPLFTAHRDFVIEHVVDPDLWRIMGLKTDRGETDPDHFFDIDDLGEAAPFAGVPRDWDAFVAKFGLARATKTGRLPFRAEELFNRLVSEFRDLGKPSPPPYAADDVRYFSAVLSHYIQDAHQPFHATVNYDGRATNQLGIHSRFETELVLRRYSELRLPAVVIQPIPDFNRFIFDAIVRSESVVDSVLRADRAAAAGRQSYDDGYFEAFFTQTRPVLEQRLADSANGTASVIVAAWRQAGSPSPPVEGPRPPARIR
jgi:hypothetical protein